MNNEKAEKTPENSQNYSELLLEFQNRLWATKYIQETWKKRRKIY